MEGDSPFWAAASRVRASFRQLGDRSDYAITFASEAVILGLGLLVFKLAATYWGPEGFGEYVLVRRGIALLQLPLACGLGVGITRFVARAPSELLRPYGGAALLIVIAVSTVSLAVLVAIPGPAAHVLFGSSRYAELIPPLSVAVAGMVLHGIAYGLFRGRFQLVRASLFQLWNIALVPLGVFLLGGRTVAQITVALGMGWIVSSALALGLGFRGGSPASGVGLRQAGKELLAYGVPRVPGELALGALFALPPIMAAHFGGIVEAGYVGFAASLLSMVGSAFAPLGVIALPAVSAAMANNGADTLRQHTRRITAACCGAAAVLVLLLEATSHLIVRYGLGAEFADATQTIRTCLLAGVPFVAYIVLRNFLDAASVAPLNARNLVVAVATFAVVSSIAGRPEFVPATLVASVTLLGVLTFRDAERVLQHPRRA